MNGGKMLRRAVGMAGKMVAGKTQPAEQALQADSQRILRPAQASKRTDSPQLAGLAAHTITAADDVGLSFCRAVRLGGRCSRAGSHKGGCRPA